MTAALAVTTVASVMTPHPVTVTPHTPFKRILELLADRAIGAVPVVSATGAVVGVVAETDLLRTGRPAGHRHGPDSSRLTAGELMTSPAITVVSDLSLARAVRTMLESGRRQLFVVDGGRLVGVLARRDVLRVFLRPDKEIRADIERDVFAAARSVRVSVDGGIVQLTGRLPWRADIDEAVARIAEIPGVIDIKDRLVCDFGKESAR